MTNKGHQWVSAGRMDVRTSFNAGEEHKDNSYATVSASRVQCTQDFSNTRLILVTDEFKRDLQLMNEIAKDRDCLVSFSQGKILLSGREMIKIAREFANQYRSATFFVRADTREEATEKLREALMGEPPINITKSIYTDNSRLIETFGRNLEKLKHDIRTST